jgi:very-short-patch-repair endonuclease
VRAVSWQGWEEPSLSEFAQLWGRLERRQIQAKTALTGRATLIDPSAVYALCFQLRIDGARLDFALVGLVSPTWICIELDGHDFHERTKEQAAKDRARERDLTARGWTVVRFTGSEIYQDVSKCWSEVLAIAGDGK